MVSAHFLKWLVKTSCWQQSYDSGIHTFEGKVMTPKARPSVGHHTAPLGDSLLLIQESGCLALSEKPMPRGFGFFALSQTMPDHLISA